LEGIVKDVPEERLNRRNKIIEKPVKATKSNEQSHADMS
jgi:hypothetical protein